MKKVNLMVIAVYVFLFPVPVYALMKIPDEELNVVMEEELKNIPFETPVPEEDKKESEVLIQGENPLDVTISDPITLEPEIHNIPNVQTENYITKSETTEARATEIRVMESDTEDSKVYVTENLISDDEKTKGNGVYQEQILLSKNIIQEKLKEVNAELQLLSLGNDISEFVRSELYDNSNYDIMTKDNKVQWRLIMIFTIIIFSIISLLAFILYSRRNYVENSII